MFHIVNNFLKTAFAKAEPLVTSVLKCVDTADIQLIHFAVNIYL